MTRVLFIPAFLSAAMLFASPAVAQENSEPKTKGDRQLQNGEYKRGPGGKGKGPGSKGKGGGMGEFDLTKEEMELIREVMGKVWNDPEVAGARKALHKATEDYQEALKKAVEKENPEALGLMKKMHEKSQMRAHQRKKMGMMPGSRARTPEELVMQMIRGEPAVTELNQEGDREKVGRIMELTKEFYKSGELTEAAQKVLDGPPGLEGVKQRAELRKLLIDHLSKQEDWIKEAFENAPTPAERFRRPGSSQGPPPGSNSGASPKRPETE